MDVLSIPNPRTGSVDFKLEVTEHSTVSANVALLRQAQKGWWENGLTKRISHLLLFADLMEQNKRELIEALTADTGRMQESILEVDGIIASIKRWCEQTPDLLPSANERTGEIPFLQIKQSYLPYQVVGIISPWNFPLLLSLVDAIPALLAGASVLLKPSEYTSRFVEPLKALLAKVPALESVFSIATGDGRTGQAAIQHADLICFTGSVATGRKVGSACAEQFIPAFLELGGKDPAIVCHDADIELAAKALCWGSMVNAGQSCMSLERVYVHQDIAPDFIQLLTKKVSELQHNFPDINSGQVGPIIAPPQVKLIQTQLDDAIAKGAKVNCGGKVVELGGGMYCQPTVLTQVTNEMKVLTEETFAAILPVVVVKTDEEAIERANDSNFGLSAAIFSKNVEYANNLAEQLEAGAISINDASLTALVHEAEKQSFKLSGLGGSRMGKGSIQRFMRKKAYIRNTGVPSPWWF